ncbi:MAG: hypothetical protein B5M53_09820 [Candidatus Cloacimonas sp. 4484_209]|nr:MAG: hypothetical protein B5M53_09820 [Candidatus Cloacimonas sp. 4484_209]
MKKRMKVYLDNAATTKCDRRVTEAMLPFFTEKYAVASSEFSHSPGIEAGEAIGNARKIIADSIGAKPDEVIFTSGGTESNNYAIKGVARANRNKGNHIISSAVEHRSIQESLITLQNEGFKITILPVSRNGLIAPDMLKKSIKKNTIMVSIQQANQETGVIQDINSIGRICKTRGILFHTDSAQSFGRIPIDVKKSNIDLLTITAHKIHGELLSNKDTQYIKILKKRLLSGIKKKLNNIKLNGLVTNTLPNILNITFRYVEGESILLHLDLKGIAVTTGSACFSRSLEPSYVLRAMGRNHEESHGSIRVKSFLNILSILKTSG